MTEKLEILSMSSIWLDDYPQKPTSSAVYSDRSPILDMTAGSRMFWWDKDNKNVVFADRRYEEYYLGTYHTKDGEKPRKCIVHPDIIADFRQLPFADNTYYMVVFDPPHLLQELAKKFTMEEIKENGLQDCEKEKVTDDGKN